MASRSRCQGWIFGGRPEDAGASVLGAEELGNRGLESVAGRGSGAFMAVLPRVDGAQNSAEDLAQDVKDAQASGWWHQEPKMVRPGRSGSLQPGS